MSKVVLAGEIEFQNFYNYEKIITQPDVTEIDVSQFSIKGHSYEDFEGDCEFCSTIALIAKLVLNKEFSTNFVIEKDVVYSSDRRVLVHCLNNESLVVPNGVEIIGHFAFCNYGLESVLFPQTIKRIGNHAFEGCERLKKVVLPNSVTQLGDRSFAYCEIKELTLSNNLKVIPLGCFVTNDLENIDIPISVKKIENSAFHGNFIKEVRLPEGVESIGSDAFRVPGYVYFPSSMREISKDFFYEEPYVGPERYIPYIEVDKDNPLFFSRDGTLYSRDNPNEPYLGYPYSGYDGLG